MRTQRIFWNDDWGFTPFFAEDLLQSECPRSLDFVRLPHTVRETPFHYFDEETYQTVSAYRRVFIPDATWEGKRLLLTIEGAAHQATVYLNGKELGSHACGYTAFTVDLAPAIRWGSLNALVIKVDSRETLNQPPFGNVIDYMTYGGIYREVYLDVKSETYIKDVFPMVTEVVTENGVSGDVTLENQITIAGTGKNLEIRQVLKSDNGAVLAQFTPEDTMLKLKNVRLWSPEHPALYRLETNLYQDKLLVDSREERIGLRKVEFTAEGLFINGSRVQLRGINRHQSYPYVGYAMPKSMQQLDADILKKELCVTAVRTSHYPQSHHFLDRCDELGLLVFTEMPGWQYVGDEDWQIQAVNNTRDMVLQYRNHPSIFMWGVRINESADYDDLYTETNEVAHKLDPSRPTSGVRNFAGSNLLEDVYSFNDFSWSGKEKTGILPRKKVTAAEGSGYMVSEYNGHMFPTKTFDDEAHRTQHLLRHAKVMDGYYEQAAEGVAGGFAWCMFDYNTHKDFGSGDRVCYHGVMDMFRNPKLPAALFASQQDDHSVLEISSSMDIGEHPASLAGDVYAVTNADSVRLYKNGRFVKEFFPADSPFKNLPHPPILMDDFVGEQLEESENMPHRQAEDVKKVLMDIHKYGMSSLPPKTLALAAKCMVSYRIGMKAMVELHNKYLMDWGGASTVFTFQAIKNGLVASTVEKRPMRHVELEVTADHTDLVEESSYDVAAIRIRAVGDNGDLLHFYNEPVSFTATGPIEVVGPVVTTLRGGMGGTYVRTLGASGYAAITVTVEDAEPITIGFNVVI